MSKYIFQIKVSQNRKTLLVDFFLLILTMKILIFLAFLTFVVNKMKRKKKRRRSRQKTKFITRKLKKGIALIGELNA